MFNNIGSFSYINSVQQKIVEDPSELIVINGVAGSRKTDTIIKKGLYELINYKKNILFLTFVSSVSNEIRLRIEQNLDIEIPKVGNSNHYLVKYNDNFIEIANIDAWIHKQLQYILENYKDKYKEKFKDNPLISNNYKKKIKDLFELTNIINFYNFVLKNNFFADVVLIDEFQDTDLDKVEILNLIISNNLNIKCIIAGDIMQTIFFSNINLINYENPMTSFINKINSTYYEINICYRCPKAHTDFVNYLIGDYYLLNKLNLIKSNNNNNLDKPVLFMHGSMSNNESAYKLALGISHAIIEILETNLDINPNDVVIIMKKSNNNYVFEQIKIILKKLYIQKNILDSIIHFETDGDGFSNTIDWNKANNKTVLLSIHGDKGKGHKVVFFLGLSKNSIPSEYNIGKIFEIFDISLLNVALTRSLKYLFIGFIGNYPSIYLNNKFHELDRYCYLSWNSSTYEKIYPYNRIISKINYYWYDDINNKNKLPKFKFIKKNNLLIPSKNELKVYEDISKNFSNYIFDVIGDYSIDTECVEIYPSLNFDLSKELYPLLGQIGELLLIRNSWMSKKNFNLFDDIKDIYFTESIFFENLIMDYNINKNINDYNTWLHKITDLEFTIKQKNCSLSYKNVLKEINDIIKIGKPVLIINKIYKKYQINEKIKIFCSSITSDQLILDHTVILLVGVLYSELTSNLKKSYFINNIENIISNKDLKIIINQINDNAIIIWNKFFLNSNINYQKNLCLESVLKDKKILQDYGFSYENNKIVFLNGLKISLKGKIDIFDENNKSIFEIKTSLKNTFSNEWFVQVVVYNLLVKIIFKIECFDNYVINLFDGTIYKINFKSDIEILKKILLIYNFNSFLIDNLLS